MNVLSNYVLPAGKGLGMKVVHADGRPESAKALGDFRWGTTVGDIVTAPDWDPTPVCGGGLHMWADGMGDLSVSGIHTKSDPASVTWLAVEYNIADAVTLGGKVKVPSCRVVASGERSAVATWLAGMLQGRAVHYGTATAGIGGTATAGYYGTATAGIGGTATAGIGGTATAGDNGTATAGYYGTATAGDNGTATAGIGGTATAGYYGTATAGIGGTATAGIGGTATAGIGGALVILWWDTARSVYRRRCAEVDGVTIKPGVAYKLDARGNFVEAK